jgi:hypothetical protein
MLKSDRPGIVLPSQSGSEFDREREILNYKPTIEYEEPPGEEDGFPTPTDNSDAEDTRKRVVSAIKSYEAIGQLAENIQGAVDQKVSTFEVQLNPSVDAHVIDAIKRCYPENKDPTKITYAMYKQCLARLGARGSNLPEVSKEDLAAAKSNPYKTDFGGMQASPGDNRPEVASPANSVQPIDLKLFQAAGIIALFKLLRPLIKLEDKKEIAEHLGSAGHLTPGAPLPTP